MDWRCSVSCKPFGRRMAESIQCNWSSAALKPEGLREKWYSILPIVGDRYHGIPIISKKG